MRFSQKTTCAKTIRPKRNSEKKVKFEDSIGENENCGADNLGDFNVNGQEEETGDGAREEEEETEGGCAGQR